MRLKDCLREMEETHRPEHEKWNALSLILRELLDDRCMDLDKEIHPHWKPWMRELVEEKDELDDKISDLERWLTGSVVYPMLSEEMKNDMKAQLKNMKAYSVNLGLRIARFHE